MDLSVAVLWISSIIIVYKIITLILKIPQISNIDSRYVLITGCGHGFGEALAKRLDSLGCHVIATFRTETGHEKLRKSCSDKLHTIHMDVSKTESVRKAYEEVTRILPEGKGLWGLVNNAGITGRIGLTEWCTKDDYEQVAAVNLFGTIDVTMTFLPLIKKEKGRVVNMSSLYGRTNTEFSLATYSVTKYGLETFSDHLRRNMRYYGVAVSIIEPTFYQTNMTEIDTCIKNYREMFESLPPSLKEVYGQEFIENECIDAAKGMKMVLKTDITPVLDAYTHALLGKFPRARYLVGYDAWIYLFLCALPEFLSDRIFLSLRANKPAICQLQG